MLIYFMRLSRSSIDAELQASKHYGQEATLLSRFEIIVSKQQEVIQSLQSEVLLLKSYISLQRANNPFQSNCSDISLNNMSTSSNESQIRKELQQSMNMENKKYERLVKHIAETLELNNIEVADEEALIETISNLKDQLRKSKEPIFVERIKQIKVPIIVEKPIEKIVYVEREPKVVQKIIEKPIFKEKIVERFVEVKKEQENQSVRMLNKTCSEVNLKPRKEEQRGFDSRYEQKAKYQPYRRGDTGYNLTKKRGDYGKPYYKRY